MNRIIRSAISIATSLSLLSAEGAVFAAEAANEEGIVDCSGMTMTFNEFAERSYGQAKPDILSNFSDGSYNLGDHLDANNTAVYKALQVLTEPSLDMIYVKLPSPLKFVTKTNDTSDDAFFEAIFTACSSGMDALSYDIPDIFWLYEGGTSVGARNMSYVKNRWTGQYTYTVNELVFAPACYESFKSIDEVKEYKKILEDTVANYKVEGNTRYDQLKSIHDQISRFTYYDLKGKFSGSALSALVEKGAVCEGYSKGFKLICDRLDIPCVCIFGNYIPEESAGHMWNYVKMDDGKWYAVDVTWDDYDGDYGVEVVYDFFLKGSKDFFKEHTEYPEYQLTKLVYPTIATNNYDKRSAVVITTSATTTSTTTTTTTTTTSTTSTTSTTKPTTTTTKSTTTTTKPTTTTTKSTTTTTKPTTTTAKSTTTTTKSTTTTAKPTTTTTKPTTTTSTSTTTTTTSTTTKTTTSTTAKSTTSATTTAPPAYEKGDLNRDGIVSVADLVYCVNHVLGAEKAKNSCDLNGDGRTDAFDVVLMRKILADKIKKGSSGMMVG